MRTHARAPAVAAVTPLAIMLADARAPAVLAAPLAVMRADARAPTVLAFALFASLAVMLAGSRAPQSLQTVLRRLCWQWACHEKVVQCPEGPAFTADRSGTKIPPGRPSGLAVQRETVIVSQNCSSKR